MATRLVRGGASVPGRRVDEDHELAALLEKGVQLGDFRLEQIALGSGDDQDRRVGRDVLLQQDERLDQEVVGLQQVGDASVAGRIRSGEVAFAMPLDEEHLRLLALHDLDDGVGEILLGIGRHPLLASVVLEDDGPERVLLQLLGERRTLLRVDVFHFQLLRDVLVFLEAAAKPLEVFGARKDRRLHGLGQPLQHFLRLVRQRVLARRGQVPPFVVPLGQIVDGGQDGEDDDHARSGERAVARLPAGKITSDLAPLAEHVEQDADEATDGESVPPAPFGPQVADRDRGKYEGHAEPAQESEKSLQHKSSVPVSRFD